MKNLIDRYIGEVEENLPEKMREDLSKEIRSLIEDTVEGRAAETGKPAGDESLIVEVLKKFGPPQKMAASYLPPRYLIGPQLYPTFWLVLRIVLTVFIVVSLVLLGVKLAQTQDVNQLWPVVGQAALEFCTSALSILGNIVFVFAVIEWFMPKLNPATDSSWDPRTMDEQVAADQFKRLDQYLGIGFTLIVMGLFNLYPQMVGFGYMENGAWTFIPVLSAEFFRYLPWLNLLWVLDLVQYAVLLRLGAWTPFMRWYAIGTRVLGMGLLLTMIFGAPLVTLPENTLFSDVQVLEPMFQQGVRGILMLIVVISAIELAQEIYRRFKK